MLPRPYSLSFTTKVKDPTATISVTIPISKASASAAATTAAPAPYCPANNCIYQIHNPTASSEASEFYKTYTASLNTAPTAIPTYLFNFRGRVGCELGVLVLDVQADGDGKG
jgi:hypothetical protein